MIADDGAPHTPPRGEVDTLNQIRHDSEDDEGGGNK